MIVGDYTKMGMLIIT